MVKKIKHCKIHDLDYTRTTCHKCYAKLYMQEYAKTHRHELVVIQTRYYRAKRLLNPPPPRIPVDPIKTRKEYYKKHRTAILLKARVYYIENKQRISKYKSKWHKDRKIVI